MPELIIDDSNWQEFVGDGEHVERPGGVFTLGAKPRKTRFGGTVACAADESFLIPRDQWDDWIARKDEEKSWLADFIKPEERRIITQAENQDGLGYCWVYCVTIAAMITRMKQNHPLIPLSAESAGGPINRWRNQGGWPEEALKRFMSHGACPQSFMDQPNSLSPNRWQTGWETAALDYRVEEFEDLSFPGKMFDAAVSAAMRDVLCPGAFNWWSHAIPGGLKVRKVGKNEYQTLWWQQWGLEEGEEGWIWLAGTRQVPDGGLFGVRSMLPKD